MPNKYPPEFYETGTLPTWEQVKASHSPEYWKRDEEKLKAAKKIVRKAKAARKR